MIFRRYIIGALAGLMLAGIVSPGSAEPAKYTFAAQRLPSPMAPSPIGSYARGCMAGGVELPETGENWQAMRLSRNRNWGHPATIAFIERLASEARSAGWPRLYVGDISQPRGGPMRSGHRSHQMRLDVDIWLRPGSETPLSRAARERISSTVVVAPDRRRLNRNWTASHVRVLRAAAEDSAVARIFVNAAIKNALCESLPADDRGWLRKIRPWWGHDAHFHVRLACPAGAAECVSQAPPPAGDGCDATLAWWFTDEALNPKPRDPDTPPRHELTLADLPPSCRQVIAK